ncbi:MAG: hypothetical protein FJ271_23430 [Planctomycetes bacterium]|nr:hypothetical protein [Planctomycetota bacterium]
MSSWPDRYLRHFMRFFGKPFDVVSYRDEYDEHLRLAIFDHAYPGYRVYASLGLSAHAHDLKGIGEAILLADDAPRDVPAIFVNALFFLLARRIDITSRFAIGGVEAVNPAFAEHFDRAAIYFAPAEGFFHGFEAVSGEENIDEEGKVYQGIFISATEQDYLNRRGPAAFEERFDAQEEDPCSLRRPPCV